jgi:hypothetical protein
MQDIANVLRIIGRVWMVEREKMVLVIYTQYSDYAFTV